MKTAWRKRALLLPILLAAGIVHAAQSESERAGFAITPDMRAAMQRQGAETPQAWLGNAIRYDYQKDPMSIDVGQRYRLPEARRQCAAGDTDACTTARGIEKWLAWTRTLPPPALLACDRSPCDRLPAASIPAALKGKTWALHAWASWCPYCRLDHARLSDIGRNRRARLVSLVYQDTESEAAKYLAGHGNPYGGGNLKSSAELIGSLGLHGVPATFIVNPRGEILQRFQGTLGEEGEQALNKYLSQ